jgi:RecA/RadA recombinase
MLKVDALLKASGNQYATVVGKDGVLTDSISAPYDSGSYTLNALLSGSIYGGLLANKITALAGEQGVGKTFFALAIAELFLEQEPEGLFAYFDTESATTKKMLVDRVGHEDRIMCLPVSTVQDFSTQVSKLLTKYAAMKEKNPDAKLLICLDSLGNLSTTKEMADIESGSGTKDMTRAQLIKGAFRALTLKLAFNQVPLLFTNHTYQGMGMFATKNMSGGSGPLYNASTVIFLTKGKLAEGTKKVGIIINMRVFKGRETKEGLTAKTRLFFETGLDRYYGIVDIIKEYGGIWDISEKQFLIDGVKVWPKTVENNPEKYLTPEILKQVDEIVQREFTYGGDDDEEDLDECSDG